MPALKTMAAALAAALVGAPLGAQDDDPVLRALLEEALARSPQLDAARQQAAAARTRAAQEGSLPGPMVGLSYQNDGLSPTLGARDMTMLSLEASQELPT